MHFVYILYSTKLDRHYIGESEVAEIRTDQHNEHLFPAAFTTAADDWTLKRKIPFKNRKNARAAERFIKRMKSRVFIEKLIQDYQWLIDKFDL